MYCQVENIQTGTLLSSVPLYCSNDPEHVKQELVRLHGIRHFDVDEDASEFAAGARFIRLPRISLSYSHYRVPVRLQFPEVDAVRQRLVISGGGIVWGNGISDEIDPTRSLIVRGDAPTWVRYSGDFEQLVISVKMDMLAKQLRHLTGAAPKTFPCFEGGVDLQSPGPQRFQRLVRFVAEELSAQNTPLPKSLLLEYEDALVTAFVISNAGDAGELFDREAPAVSPWQVRATEEFIEANWQRAITVELLAEQIGASARSIFKTFKDARGYSPMVFLKRTRLKHARENLQSAIPSVTVTGTGLAAGFQNLSHFAKDYAREFGETPSETLRRARSSTL